MLRILNISQCEIFNRTDRHLVRSPVGMAPYPCLGCGWPNDNGTAVGLQVHSRTCEKKRPAASGSKRKARRADFSDDSDDDRTSPILKTPRISVGDAHPCTLVCNGFHALNDCSPCQRVLQNLSRHRL